MEKISLPMIKEEKIDEKTSRIIIEPLFPGYGHTLGNSLRRVLLSSIPGAAITSFKIENVPHEFTSIPHVKEDMVEIMLNLKTVQFLSYTWEPVRLTLSANNAGQVVAGDFSKNSDIEIMNPDSPIATLDKNAEFELEVTIEKDRGFRSTDNVLADTELGRILVDAAFSPVERVKVEVENTRVGQMTNYDKLILEITTNGSISPRECMIDASNILIEHYKVFAFNEEPKEIMVEEYIKYDEENENLTVDDSEDINDEIDPKTKIEDAGLSPRTTNALISSGVKTLAGLYRLSDLKLSEIKGLGKKGIEEIKELIGQDEKAE